MTYVCAHIEWNTTTVQTVQTVQRQPYQHDTIAYQHDTIAYQHDTIIKEWRLTIRCAKIEAPCNFPAMIDPFVHSEAQVMAGTPESSALKRGGVRGVYVEAA